MRRLFICLMLTVLTGCAQQPVKDDSLYQDLGQRAGIQRIVEGMLINVARDERIVARFKRVNIVLLRDRLVEKLCVETGGPCRYTGDSMAESHKGQNLTPSDFNALVENLIASMDAEHIPVPVQNRLIARLAPMRGEVIGK
ncbi:group I truncated hemoglobin [Pseudomonas cannabina]|uniref:Cyanoglobin3B Hemoglobin-like protein HbN n=3 Tax=Pseudomonas syringae group TaxID=136849 RepID=A0A3M3RCF8_PSECA|nr:MULTISPECIES: group 1 truncated hemoglobin [Pseudomonas syringae group]KPB73225.1 Protozoan/cyanobacterial globin family protein [Pseudomonas syringae pv. maculicola]KPW18200.1 Protozoan/cyanobacterial globin family protein [Pseudomonas cannabina pv. alisalensis]MBM0141973.1 group 1 truncated hemoglobin [Pseudomonas cannabina pv. alisalensis]QHE98725.1 group 1 truncated hemoglobin [Pseudomonas syringae pv. maculicola str. ES4326]QQN20941.1 group 1 truncated hemoglobin [Pseudomonas cannabina